MRRAPVLRPRIFLLARGTACGVVGVSGIALGVGLTSVSAGASSSPASVVASARKAILSATAVRIVSTDRDTKTKKISETAQFDATAELERAEIYDIGSAHVAIRLTVGGAYFSGNKDGLTSVFSMPADDVAKVGTKWVAIGKSEAQYKDFSSAVLSSVPGYFLPTSSAMKSVRLTTKNVSGKSVDVLTWSVTSSGVKDTFALEVAASGVARPIEETQLSGTTRRVTMFGHWNERLAVPVPHDTIAFSSLSST